MSDSSFFELPLAWKSHLNVAPISEPEPGIVVLDSDGGYVVHDPILPELVPLLNQGSFTAADLTAHFYPRIPGPHILLTIERLGQRGWLQAPSPPFSPSVHVLNPLPAHWREEFQALCPGDEQTPLEIVLCRDYLDPQLVLYAQQAWKAGKSWCPLMCNGQQVWLGPIFASQAPCFFCLRTRLVRNRPVYQWLYQHHPQSRLFGSAPEVCLARLRLSLAWAVTQLQQVRVDALWENDLARNQTIRHPVTRQLHCPMCGEPPVEAGPPELAPRLKKNPQDDRLLTLEEVAQRLASTRSRLTGLVSEIFSSSGGDALGIPIKTAIFAKPFSGKTAKRLGDTCRGTAAGKALREDRADTMALCEALERLAFYPWKAPQTHLASLDELGEEALDPRTYFLFSELQFQEREVRNARTGLLDFIPLPYDSSVAIRWSKLWSLTRQRWRYFPCNALYAQTYVFPEDEGKKYFYYTSNGAASGSCLEEALFHGILETIERDAAAIWWFNRICRPRVDLSEASPLVNDLVGRLRHIGRESWVLDLTHDLGVPVMVAISRRTEGPERVVVSFGCHPDALRALEGAFMEHVQLLTYVNGEGSRQMANVYRQRRGQPPLTFDPDKFVHGEPTVNRWYHEHSCQTDPHLLPSGESRRLGDFPAWEGSPDIADDVRVLQKQLEKKGLEVLFYPCPVTDAELSVVRVIIPGLRHIHPQLAPGRLYDVPVQLGWLPSPRKEEELNPLAVVI